jgi:hypothetical protein
MQRLMLRLRMCHGAITSTFLEVFMAWCMDAGVTSDEFFLYILFLWRGICRTLEQFHRESVSLSLCQSSAAASHTKLDTRVTVFTFMPGIRR